MLLLGFVCLSGDARAQSGGQFSIEKTVIAPGGNAAGGAFAVQGVLGQPSAGTANGGQFSVGGGFITPQFVPTAASASISGKVVTFSGVGIRNANVVITDMSGNQQTVRTGTFGYFRFDGIEVGRTYLITVTSARFQFAPQVVTVNENIGELNFSALSEPSGRARN